VRRHLRKGGTPANQHCTGRAQGIQSHETALFAWECPEIGQAVLFFLTELRKNIIPGYAASQQTVKMLRPPFGMFHASLECNAGLPLAVRSKSK
jgi:hypothetical protein